MSGVVASVGTDGEPSTIVGDRKPHISGLVVESHSHSSRARVLDDVHDRFLRYPNDCRLDRGVEPSHATFHRTVELEPRIAHD